MRTRYFSNEIISLIGICAFAGIFLAPGLLRGEAIEELQTKINDRNAQIKQLEGEIRLYQTQLADTSKQKQTLQTTLANLTISSKKLAAEIKLTENKITATNLNLQELESGIEDKSDRLDRNKKSIQKSLQNLSILENDSLIENLLNQKTLSDAWNEMESIKQLENTIKKNSDETKEVKAELESTKVQVEIQKKKLLALNAELSDRQKLLVYNQKQTADLLSTTKNKESNYIKLIDDKITLRAAFEKELLDFESKLKFEYDASKLPSPGSGVLKWPLDSVKITQYFGNTEFAKANSALYNGQGHNGIDLRASVGTPIKASATGVVLGTGDTDQVCPGASYGKWVLIKHRNGLTTLYAHLSLIKVTKDQDVVMGETIGYSGNTGYSTGPHLHFTVYASDAVQILKRKSAVCAGSYTMPIAALKGYLNPLSYL
jgi:murein DD-endopeptidase MepM/ murein hydrolase activator NlpD